MFVGHGFLLAGEITCTVAQSNSWGHLTLILSRKGKS
jgi:hypothetical protein